MTQSPASISDFERQLAEAVRMHQAGDLINARAIYETLHQAQPERADLQHNLGLVLLGLGFLKQGVELIQQAIAREPEKIGALNTFNLVGNLLTQHQYWEFAQPWLLAAAQKNPDDKNISTTLARLSARDYLAPEIFDPLAQQTLLRYSPRESETYVYAIDVVGTCNLRCPTCPVGNSQDPSRATGFMSVELFKKILEKINREKPCDHPQIWLYSWGEPLLHPQLAEIVQLVKSFGFTCHLSTNLNIEKGLKELIKAGPDEIKISLSGFTQTTYSETHAKGNLLLVKSNLYKLRSLIDQYQATTRVWVGHHLYKHNRDQSAAVQALCNELGFDYRPVQAFYQPLEKLLALAQGDARVEQEPILQNLIVPPEAQMAFSKKHQMPDYDCELRFNQTVINADGSVSQCCCQYETKNMLGIQFLDFDHQTIEQKKYTNPICVSCRANGLDYAPRQLPDSIIASQ